LGCPVVRIESGAIISGLYYKSFTIVIYDRNDNSLYYKTMIVANLALARSVHYDLKVCCKLKHTFTIVNYDPKHYSTGHRSFSQLALLARVSQ
jgi:hypothetical protein